MRDVPFLLAVLLVSSLPSAGVRAAPPSSIRLISLTEVLIVTDICAIPMTDEVRAKLDAAVTDAGRRQGDLSPVQYRAVAESLKASVSIHKAAVCEQYSGTDIGTLVDQIAGPD